MKSITFGIVVGIILLVLAVSSPIQADPHNTAGVKLDAPNLVKITKNISLGFEGGKNLATDLFYKSGDGVEYFEADRGYFGYVKFTINNCLLNCG